MDALLAEHARLENKGNLKKSIDDVQRIIDLLEAARENVVASKILVIRWRARCSADKSIQIPPPRLWLLRSYLNPSRSLLND